MKLWVMGARPRTLTAAVVPVAVGTAAALPDEVWWRAALALVVALALQVGVNYANDYSDGIRGTDRRRIGPVRLVGSGSVTPARVRWAAFGAFGVAMAAGLVLALVVNPWLVAVGAACVVAGWFYTGGPRPYGYTGFGEVFVFVFFGLVATAGTTYVQTETIFRETVVVAVSVGLMASALLVANNLRDIALDQAVGKRTLAVRLGAKATGWVYVVMVSGALSVGASLAIFQPWMLLSLAAFPFAIPATNIALAQSAAAPMLNITARLQLVHGALLTLGLALSA